MKRDAMTHEYRQAHHRLRRLIPFWTLAAAMLLGGCAGRMAEPIVTSVRLCGSGDMTPDHVPAVVKLAGVR